MRAFLLGIAIAAIFSSAAISQSKEVRATFGQGCSGPFQKFGNTVGACQKDNFITRVWCANSKVYDTVDTATSASDVSRICARPGLAK